LRSDAAWSAPGGFTSSTKQPRPCRSRGSSLRGMRAPMLRVVIGSGAPRGRAGGRARLYERLERAVEADARRLDETGADLPHPGLAMRHARVDLREDPGLYYQPDVDPGRRAAKIERGQSIGGALAERDLVHEPRVLERVRGCAADELNDRRRAAHREAAETACLGDGAVTDVGIGVAGAEPGEVEPLGRLCGPGEPPVAEPTHANPEVGAVARHRRHDRRIGHAVGG